MSSFSSHSGLPSPVNSSRIPRLRSERPSIGSSPDSQKSTRPRSPRQVPKQQAHQEHSPHATVQNGSKARVISLTLDNFSSDILDQRTSTPVPVHKHRHAQDRIIPLTSSPSSGASSPVRASSRANLRYTPTSKLSSNNQSRSSSPAPSSSCSQLIGQRHGSDQPDRFQTPQHHRVRHQLASGVTAIPGRRLETNLRALQVPPASPNSPLPPSPPHSASFPTTPQLPRRFRPKATYSYLQQPSSPSVSASFQTVTSSLSSPPYFEAPSYLDFDTPSPSPRPRRSRASYSSFSTPSARHTQRHHHRASLQLPPPPTFLIRRGLLPGRAKPTLAMSIQIHAPSPIMSTQPLSPSSLHHHQIPTQHRSSSRSRPSSPLSVSTQLPPVPPLSRPPMTRPPSRSERLLRDTLRRAEEQERLANLAVLPSPAIIGGMASQALAPGFVLNAKASTSAVSPRRHVRRNTSSSSATDGSLGSMEYFKGEQHPRDIDTFDNEVDDDDDVDEQEWLWRTRSATSTSSSSSLHLTGQPQAQGYHYTSRTGLARQNSTDKAYPRSRAHTDPTGGEIINGLAPAAEIVYGTPVSPLPATTRAALQRSVQSAPNVARPGHSKRTSMEYAHHENGLQAKENGGHGVGAMTPHEAVLRSRLEGVLRGAKEQERRTRSRERERNGSGSGSGSGSGASNSMASSRNLSGEGEWFFGGASEYTTSPMSDQAPTTTTRKRTSMSSPKQQPSTNRTPSSTHTATARNPSQPSSPRQNPHHQHTLLTPPPTPPSPFNAHTAAAQCRAMDGYVSFANIEGLGVPGGEDDDGDEDGGAKGRWLKWLNVGAAVRGRGRSDSASSLASR